MEDLGTRLVTRCADKFTNVEQRPDRHLNLGRDSAILKVELVGEPEQRFLQRNRLAIHEHPFPSDTGAEILDKVTGVEPDDTSQSARSH